MSIIFFRKEGLLKAIPTTRNQGGQSLLMFDENRRYPLPKFQESKSVFYAHREGVGTVFFFQSSKNHREIWSVCPAEYSACAPPYSGKKRESYMSKKIWQKNVGCWSGICGKDVLGVPQIWSLRIEIVQEWADWEKRRLEFSESLLHRFSWKHMDCFLQCAVEFFRTIHH